MPPTANPSLSSLRELLVARAHIPGPPDEWTLQPFSPNPNRKDLASRRRFVLSRAGTRPVLITVDSCDSDLAVRSAAFARACPELSSPVLFRSSADEIHIIGHELFDGVPLDLAVENGILSAADAVSLVREILRILDQTSRAARPRERGVELTELSSNVATIPDLAPSDLRFLIDDAMPALRAACAALPARSRWSNGDFIARNILVSRDRKARLIDYEFARLTSFPEEDWFRLLNVGHDSPALASMLRAEPVDQPNWLHLYFWLRQLSLEARVNNDRLFAASLPGLLNCVRSAYTLVEPVRASHSRIPASLRPLTRALRSFFPLSRLPASLQRPPEG